MKFISLTPRLTCSVIILITGVLLACASTTDNKQLAEYQPALLNKPSPLISGQLEQLISGMLNGQKITLADKVFSKDSTITIERNSHINQQGQLLEGKHQQTVQSFKLLTKDQQCYLHHQQTEKIIELPNISCQAQAQ
ncbi:MAG: hypothetical protein ACSHW0_11255 [Thalassotalea sp.]